MSSESFEAAPQTISKIVRPFQTFAKNETSGGIVLLFCTVIALVWANSRWAESYTAVWHTNLTIGLAGRNLSHDLHFWVNDFLMAIFFFVVGLEIKREVLVGELASLRQASLPILGAIGGVVVPALIYAAFNHGGPGTRGWGIPMATDIAFSLGVMTLLGKRVPLGLKVFLAALAIADDIVAVLVIAVFYTADISWAALGIATACLGLLFVLSRLGARTPLTYALWGCVLWAAVLASGVHATIAGVALAAAIPSRTLLDRRQFLIRSRQILGDFENCPEAEGNSSANEERQAAIHALEEACESVQPPLLRMEHALHPWVTFAIMPLFALANAGVALTGNITMTLAEPIALGVIVGLLLGKPIGITFAAWLAVRSGVAALPTGVGWVHMHGAAWLAGIGFTMSLFIATLAFRDEAMLTTAKLGILTASVFAGVAGTLILLRTKSSTVRVVHADMTRE